MTDRVFLFGTIAGLIVIGVAILSVLAGIASELFGYLTMIVALSTIFFAVKRYRDQELGGVIKFLPAFMMGLGIAVVAGVIYVLVWEVYLVATNYAFFDAYTSTMIEAERAKGATAEAIDALTRDMQALKVQYQNPLFRLPLTFLEIFPVGFIIALISAALLSNPTVLPARA